MIGQVRATAATKDPNDDEHRIPVSLLHASLYEFYYSREACRAHEHTIAVFFRRRFAQNPKFSSFLTQRTRTERELQKRGGNKKQVRLCHKNIISDIPNRIEIDSSKR